MVVRRHVVHRGWADVALEQAESQPPIDAAASPDDDAPAVETGTSRRAGATRARRAAAPGPRTAALGAGDGPSPDENRIGVVFVHGIGNQAAGETLLAWARPLLRLIQRWSATTDGVAAIDPVVRANVDFSGETLPIIEARVPASGDHAAQTWVLTEAFWASQVRPPGVGEMFRWLFGRNMIRIVRGITGGFRRAGLPFWATIDTLFLFVLMIPATILILVVYALFRLLRMVPIKPLQDLAILAAIEFFLAEWFGDIRVLLTDRVQASNIRARVAAAVEALQKLGCGPIVIVAHSGGTVVSYMTLADPRYRNLPVDRLITHGQALTLAWRLGQARQTPGRDDSLDRIYPYDAINGSLADRRAGPNGERTFEWHDFQATHDPAPAGGFVADDVAVPADFNGAEHRIYNRMSLRNDHGVYWDNDESFVLPVARLIETAGTRGASRFFAAEPAVTRAARREQRVRLGAWAWLAVSASSIAAVIVALLDVLQPGDRGTLIEAGHSVYGVLGTILGFLGGLYGLLNLPELPSELPDWAAFGVGIVGLIVLYSIVSRAMVSIWDRWDQRERVMALRPEPAWVSTRPLATALSLAALAALALFGFAATGQAVWLAPPAVLLVLAWLATARLPLRLRLPRRREPGPAPAPGS